MASVVGTLFMVMVFMAAIGAQVYLSGVEAQSFQASQQAQETLAKHSAESLTYADSPSGLEVTDTGPDSVEVVAMVLKFGNGTVYDLGPGSSPAFAPATIPSSGAAQVGPLVPAGDCSPEASCASEFDSIVEGSAGSGDAVGLVTSLGNTFWFVPGADGSGQGSAEAYWTTSSESTTSSSFVPVPGLSFDGASGGFYVVQVDVPFWAETSVGTAIAFAISVPHGDSFVFCGGLYWSDPGQSTTDFAPGNECTDTTGTSLGTTSDTQWSCTSSSDACEFVGTAYVSFSGGAGAFQFEYRGSASNAAEVSQDAAIFVTPAS